MLYLRTYDVKWKDHWQIIDWKGFVRKWSWLILGAIPAYDWRDEA
jgi:hypothetical protein